MRTLPILKGLATYVPLLYRPERGSTGGTDDARYCYSVWLRHFTLLSQAGLLATLHSVAELGPGDSLGIGLAALISGAHSLIALDVVRYANMSRNHVIVDELVQLFRRRAGIPTDGYCDGIFPPVQFNEFPEAALSPEKLRSLLGPGRIKSIHLALDGQDNPHGISIRYAVPWHMSAELAAFQVDLLFSQAVLEHVDDLPRTYNAFSRWVKPGGAMSHVIDFRSHKITPTWDGHRQYPGPIWHLVKGRRPFLLNRQPLQSHLELMERSGFKVCRLVRQTCQPTLQRSQMAKQFRMISSEDLSTSSALIQALKSQ